MDESNDYKSEKIIDFCIHKFCPFIKARASINRKSNIEMKSTMNCFIKCTISKTRGEYYEAKRAQIEYTFNVHK